MTDLNNLVIQAQQNAQPGSLAGGIPGGVNAITWGCGSCPDFVLGVLAKDCRESLTIIMRIKRIVTIINRCVTAIVEQVVDDLRRLVALVPIPPFLNVSDIIGLLTCPLTPQALVVEQMDMMLNFVTRNKSPGGLFLPDPAESLALASQYTLRDGTLLQILDPDALKKRIAEMIDKYVREIQLLIENFMDSLPDGGTYLRLIKRFWDEIRSLTKSADLLIVRLSMTKASVALIRATCPAVFDRADLPFQKFEQESKTFSYDGLLPSGLSAEAQPIAELLLEIELKIMGWVTIPLVMV